MCEHAALAAAAAHACACWPLEACGAVVRDRRGLRFVPIANVAAEPRTSFAFGAGEQLALYRAASAGSLELVAFVHSHPGAGPEFSEQDRRDATADDGSPLHPGLEHWVLAIRGPTPAFERAMSWAWRSHGWIGRALAPPPVAGCVSCVAPENRL